MACTSLLLRKLTEPLAGVPGELLPTTIDDSYESLEAFQGGAFTVVMRRALCSKGQIHSPALTARCSRRTKRRRPSGAEAGQRPQRRLPRPSKRAGRRNAPRRSRRTRPTSRSMQRISTAPSVRPQGLESNHSERLIRRKRRPPSRCPAPRSPRLWRIPHCTRTPGRPKGRRTRCGTSSGSSKPFRTGCENPENRPKSRRPRRRPPDARVGSRPTDPPDPASGCRPPSYPSASHPMRKTAKPKVFRISCRSKTEKHTTAGRIKGSRDNGPASRFPIPYLST